MRCSATLEAAGETSRFRGSCDRFPRYPEIPYAFSRYFSWARPLLVREVRQASRGRSCSRYSGAIRSALVRAIVRRPASSRDLRARDHASATAAAVRISTHVPSRVLGERPVRHGLIRQGRSQAGQGLAASAANEFMLRLPAESMKTFAWIRPDTLELCLTEHQRISDCWTPA